MNMDRERFLPLAGESQYIVVEELFSTTQPFEFSKNAAFPKQYLLPYFAVLLTEIYAFDTPSVRIFLTRKIAKNPEI